MPEDSDHPDFEADIEYVKARRFPGAVIYEDGGYDLDLAKRSVGAGWHGFLERLFAAKPTWVQVVQVKEKFGGLRVYTADMPVRVDCIGMGSFFLPETRATGLEGLTDAQQARALEFEDLIRKTEAESFQACETCGAPGCLRPHGWLLTLCDACDIAMHAKSGRHHLKGVGGPGCRMPKRGTSEETPD
jgi:hypothetical protein